MGDQDRLNGASNFGIWKEIMPFLLDEYGMKEYIENVIARLTDPQKLETYKKKNSKSKRIILNGFKHHIFPHIIEKHTTKQMWDVILNLYQNTEKKNMNLIFRENLRTIKMQKGEYVVSYLASVQLARDELAAIQVITI